eukprot:c24662_g1_i1 orf=2-475(+)
MSKGENSSYPLLSPECAPYRPFSFLLELSPLLILPFYFLHSPSILAADNHVHNPSFLTSLSEPSPFHLLFLYNLRTGYTFSAHLVFTVRTPTPDQGLFFPILPSPSFHSSISSHSRGFSLGLKSVDQLPFKVYRHQLQLLSQQRFLPWSQVRRSITL